jgi:hypothetical protein
LLHAWQRSAAGPAVTQIGVAATQYEFAVHSTHEPKRGFSSRISQTGVEPVQPFGCPSSADVHGRQ